MPASAPRRTVQLTTVPARDTTNTLEKSPPVIFRETPRAAFCGGGGGGGPRGRPSPLFGVVVGQVPTEESRPHTSTPSAPSPRSAWHRRPARLTRPDRAAQRGIRSSGQFTTTDLYTQERQGSSGAVFGTDA